MLNQDLAVICWRKEESHTGLDFFAHKKKDILVIFIYIFARTSCLVTDGVFAGYAVCHGNLYTGAFWDQWEIDVSCKNTERTDEFISIHSNEDVASSEPLQNVSNQRLIPSTPSAALLSIDEVSIFVFI